MSAFQIGTYLLAPYARTEKHIRELAECGIDFVTCMALDRAALDLMHRHGIRAIVSGAVPEWFGGHGENAGQLQNQRPLEDYDRALERFADHPAIMGVSVGDEPSALDFPWYGQIIARVQQHLPEKMVYLNLYPSYGMLASNTPEQMRFELRADSYADYLSAYCRHVPADYLCFDCYPYSSGDAHVLLHCLRTASDACLRTDRRLWVVLQVNSHTPDAWISTDQLRHQAFSAMAFGAETIQWACYTAGWWHNQVLDERGEKTQQYEKLQTVNAEIRRLAGPYMRYRPVRTLDLSEDPVTCGVFTDLRAEKVLAGYRTGEDGEALMLYSVMPTELSFRADVPSAVLLTAAGEQRLHPDADGSFRIALSACQGALLMLKS